MWPPNLPKMVGNSGVTATTTTSLSIHIDGTYCNAYSKIDENFGNKNLRTNKDKSCRVLYAQQEWLEWRTFWCVGTLRQRAGVDQCIEDIVIALVHMDEIWHINRVRSWYGFYTQREVATIYVFSRSTFGKSIGIVTEWLC